MLSHLSWSKPQDSDEAAHLLSGMEILQYNSYTYERMHPPLARIVAALPLYLIGIRIEPGQSCRSFTEDYVYNKENATGAFGWDCLVKADLSFLDRQPSKQFALAYSRTVLWIFYIFCCIGIFWLTLALGENKKIALIATLLFSQLPLVVFFSSIVMTDMAFTAFLTLTLAAAAFWLQKPSWSAMFGVCFLASMTILSKYSAFIYLPLALLSLLLWHPIPRLGQIQLLTAPFIVFFLVWGAFGFAIDRPISVIPALTLIDNTGEAQEADAIIAKKILPMPHILEGIFALHLKNEKGHIDPFTHKKIPGCANGCWWYYPTLLLIKTPLFYLALACIGLVCFWKKKLSLFCIAMVSFILGFAMASKIQINLHHILPAFIPLSMLASLGFWKLWKHSNIGKYNALILLAFYLISSVTINMSRLDYRGYYNSLTHIINLNYTF